MFEKSLVDLIRGLRGHKGQESEYIRNALKECRNEIRSQDMDVKSAALLKLIYLEMMGHDMAWAAFNVLEVMASSKQMQKRVGYLAAVQTFRPETEVLMLAENLLKKDLTSPSIPTLSLPLVTIPHIVTPSLALSILTELLPRLSHSQPAVRKKTVVSLYRLALVYPETLRVAWPKIKERLLDEKESSSVTHAAVNVVCELGWRRPQDFLSLAPRLFELLTSDKNNWMSIKIIKLFAVLTPLEPRLVKKLVRPLTKILRETSAMSLLYECISGIIQGGILDGAEAGVDVDEVADLCISKLRGMIVLEGDPNLKYVALLAFNKIVGSHPKFISQQQDVIMACLDDPDISIKMQALELVSGMVDSDNLYTVVNRLMKQLANAPMPSVNGTAHFPENGENTDLEQRLIPDKRGSELAPLPDEYRHEIISRILDMCSGNTYANITDFEWYIEILVHLVRHLPSDTINSGTNERLSKSAEISTLGSRIGTQLLDIAVRVKELRADATQAAEKLLLISNRSIIFASHAGGQAQILKSAAWICGEYASSLSSLYEVLNSLVHDSSQTLPASTLSTFTQAIPKVLCRVVAISNQEWNTSRSTTLGLLLARAVDFLEKLSLHPNLEVQERSVEFLELLKVASDALSSQPNDATSAPPLLSSVIPSLFADQDLNPVAAGAQSKVPVSADLDLDSSINPDLTRILQDSQLEDAGDGGPDIYDDFYHERIPDSVAPTVLQATSRPASHYLDRPSSPEPQYQSYQQSALDSPSTLARRKADRLARSRDDPFYIPPSESGRSTPIHRILQQSNGGPDDLDIDAIPIIDLQIDTPPHAAGVRSETEARKKPTKKKPARKFAIAADETLDPDPSSSQSGTNPASLSTTPTTQPSTVRHPQPQLRPPTRNLLSISSSDLGSFSLSSTDNPNSSHITAADLLRQQEEEKEMAAALALIEQKRLEMQRVEERRGVSYAEGVDAEGTGIRRKKKKARKERVEEDGDEQNAGQGEVVVTKKKKPKKKPKPAEEGDDDGGAVDDGEGVVKKKKKVKRKVGAPAENLNDERREEREEPGGSAEQEARGFDIS